MSQVFGHRIPYPHLRSGIENATKTKQKFGIISLVLTHIISEVDGHG